VAAATASGPSTRAVTIGENPGACPASLMVPAAASITWDYLYADPFMDHRMSRVHCTTPGLILVWDDFVVRLVSSQAAGFFQHPGTGDLEMGQLWFYLHRHSLPPPGVWHVWCFIRRAPVYADPDTALRALTGPAPLSKDASVSNAHQEIARAVPVPRTRRR
jgi:hypothetical protein